MNKQTVFFFFFLQTGFLLPFSQNDVELNYIFINIYVFL